MKGNSFVGNEKNVHSEFTTPEELTLLELGKLCGSFCVSSIVIILTPLVLFIRRTPRQREHEVIGTDRISSQIMALKETLKSLQEMCLEVTYFFWLIAVVFVWPFILFYGLATGTDTQEELLWVTVFNFVFLSFFVGIPILGHLSTRKIILQELAELYEARERELQRLASL